MESLDLQTGFNVVMAKREQRLAALAARYQADTADFEEEERRVKE